LVDQDQDGLNTVAIAGGVGGGAVLISVIALIFCIRHDYKKKQKDEDWSDPTERSIQDTRPRSGRRNSWSSNGEEDFKTRRSQYRSMTHPIEEENADDYRNKESSSFLDRRYDRDSVQTWNMQQQDTFSDTGLRYSRQKGYSHRSEYSDSGVQPKELEDHSSTLSRYKSLEYQQDHEDDWDRHRRPLTRYETIIEKQQETSMDRSERLYSSHLGNQLMSRPLPSPTTQRLHLKYSEFPQPRDPHICNSQQIGLQFGYVKPNDPQFISDTNSSRHIDSHSTEKLLQPELQDGHISTYEPKHTSKSQRRDPQNGVPPYFNPNFDTPQPGNPQIGGSKRGTIFSHLDTPILRGLLSSRWLQREATDNTVPRTCIPIDK
ncbi:hypothetical protein BGW38_002650, partial [Lunasporangiospora selenospora]